MAVSEVEVGRPYRVRPGYATDMVGWLALPRRIDESSVFGEEIDDAGYDESMWIGSLEEIANRRLILTPVPMETWLAARLADYYDPREEDG